MNLAVVELVLFTVLATLELALLYFLRRLRRELRALTKLNAELREKVERLKFANKALVDANDALQLDLRSIPPHPVWSEGDVRFI